MVAAVADYRRAVRFRHRFGDSDGVCVRETYFQGQARTVRYGTSELSSAVRKKRATSYVGEVERLSDARVYCYLPCHACRMVFAGVQQPHYFHHRRR